MPATKHHIMRLSDEHWKQLADTLRAVVPPENRPARANPESDWQITEGLRMLADGELSVIIVKPHKRKRANNSSTATCQPASAT